MSILAYVDYGFILVFFAVLLGVVLLMGLSQGKKATVQEESATPLLKRQNMLDYGIIVALFTVFILVTLFTHKQSSST